jgi:hypothetical protein
MNGEPFVREAMIAVAAASPVLAGLTGVVMGQVWSYKLGRFLNLFFILFFVDTLILVFLAARGAIDWLLAPDFEDYWQPATLFSVQLGLFLGALVVLWIVLFFRGGRVTEE